VGPTRHAFPNCTANDVNEQRRITARLRQKPCRPAEVCVRAHMRLRKRVRLSRPPLPAVLDERGALTQCLKKCDCYPYPCSDYPYPYSDYPYPYSDYQYRYSDYQ
jgi:hypothetical protein